MYILSLNTDDKFKIWHEIKVWWFADRSMIIKTCKTPPQHSILSKKNFEYFIEGGTVEYIF